jgi:hypothetical protein
MQRLERVRAAQERAARIQWAQAAAELARAEERERIAAAELERSQRELFEALSKGTLVPLHVIHGEKAAAAQRAACSRLRARREPLAALERQERGKLEERRKDVRALERWLTRELEGRRAERERSVQRDLDGLSASRARDGRGERGLSAGAPLADPPVESSPA